MPKGLASLVAMAPVDPDHEGTGAPEPPPSGAPVGGHRRPQTRRKETPKPWCCLKRFHRLEPRGVWVGGQGGANEPRASDCLPVPIESGEARVMSAA
jgi:hypothetical protein